jgi:hypothetical protein
VPSVPSDSFQLVMVLAFLVPGSVYQFVRARLRGPAPDDSSSLNRVLRALTFSAGLVTSYALLGGRPVLELVGKVQGANRQAALEAVAPLAAWALALLFVIPSALAALVFYLPRWGGGPSGRAGCDSPMTRPLELGTTHSMESRPRMCVCSPTMAVTWAGGMGMSPSHRASPSLANSSLRPRIRWARMVSSAPR